ncbi:MAG TPA: hypothetical protein VN516_08450 [Candidatus Baltobacteraceae bacterium]|nr:hypothetical protein [Candidatus Baltobacteraceae bacterium]
MLALAMKLGQPTVSRKEGSLIDELRPTPREWANPASLSARYGIGAFPLHTDTAHWRKPARYVILRAVQISRGNRPTLLLDKDSLDFELGDRFLLKRAVFTVRNGRNSFLTTIFPEDEKFLRFDRDCMFPKTSSSTCALDLILSAVEKRPTIKIHWRINDTLVFDNWRFLHGRNQQVGKHVDRRLLHRILVATN